MVADTNEKLHPADSIPLQYSQGAAAEARPSGLVSPSDNDRLLRLALRSNQPVR
jgi:hypothetical protein